MFQTPPTFYFFCFAHWQDKYEKLREKFGDSIVFSETLPTEEELTKLMEGHEHGIFICDDKSREIQTQGEFFHNLVTRLAHHLRLTNILLVQDAGLNGKAKSTLARNCHVNVLMRSPKERAVVRTLGLQLGEYKCLMGAYDDATSVPFGYLVLDTHPLSPPQLKMRTNVLPDDNKACIIYQAKKKEY